MSAVEAQALRRNSLALEWAAFAVQAIIAVAFELGDELGRTLFSQHGTLQGIQNARSVVSFEAAHGFWVEPAWQTFFLQTRHLFDWTVTWLDMVRLMNGIYIGCHVFVTLGVAIWVYFYRRRHFALLRNVIIVTNGLALVIYETFPVAPPRLTTDLLFNHHQFIFQDTVFGTISTGGKLVGTQIGYNEFSAMPSVHMAWALVIGATLVVLARPKIVKVLGCLYPLLMLITVVATGNHFLMDAVGACIVVSLAASACFALARWKGTHAWPRLLRQAVVGKG